jgi:predicted ATPase
MGQIKKLGGVFVTGTYDMYLRDEPYSGLIDALDELFGQILDTRDEKGGDVELDNICQQILRVLGPETELLTRLIPRLDDIIRDMGGPTTNNPAAGDGNGLQSKSQQLNYTFRNFIHLMCSLFGPLVLLLDDLQWADMKSLEVLDLLITNRDHSNLMIIGTYRSNEVAETHVLSKTMRDLHEKSEQDNQLFHITEMQIGNLGLEAINQVLLALLGMDDESKTRGLAEICLTRTHGNVFFFIKFVNMLHERKLLEFNLGIWKWEWDESTIETNTASAANVVDILSEKMKNLSDQMGRFLQIAACLGSSLSENILEIGMASQGEGPKFSSTTGGSRRGKLF